MDRVRGSAGSIQGMYSSLHLIDDHEKAVHARWLLLYNSRSSEMKYIDRSAHVKKSGLDRLGEQARNAR